MKNFESRMELTGSLFEEEAVGKVDTKNPEYQQALKKAQEEEAKEGVKSGYIRFRKALELARKFQPADPTNPNKYFSRDLRIALQDLLSLKTEEEMDRVKFYTAAGTPLDTFHGVDAFLEYEDERKQTHRATFDFTANPHKQVYKSDIMVLKNELPDPDLESQKYLEKIEGYAKEVFSKITAEEKTEKETALKS